MKETVANTKGAVGTASSDITFSLASHVYIGTFRLAGVAAINGTGNELDNALFGNFAANILKGAGGNDEIIGDGGDDTIDGGSGNDTLQGREGADIVSAGLGDDYTLRRRRPGQSGGGGTISSSSENSTTSAIPLRTSPRAPTRSASCPYCSMLRIQATTYLAMAF